MNRDVDLTACSLRLFFLHLNMPGFRPSSSSHFVEINFTSVAVISPMSFLQLCIQKFLKFVDFQQLIIDQKLII